MNIGPFTIPILSAFFIALAGLAYHKRRDIARAMKSTRRYPLDRF